MAEFFTTTRSGIVLLILGQCLLVLVPLLLALAFLMYADRKVWAAVQMRRGPERRRRLRPAAVLRRLPEIHRQGNRRARRRRPGGVLPRADDLLRAGDDRLGGDPVQRRLGAGRHQRGHPLRLRDLLARGLRRDHGRLGVELEVPVPRLAAVGGADDLLRGLDRPDHHRRHHLDRLDELQPDRAGAGYRLGPAQLVLAAALPDAVPVLHLGAGRDQPPALRPARGGVGTRGGLSGGIFLDAVPAVHDRRVHGGRADVRAGVAAVLRRLAVADPGPAATACSGWC